MIVNGGKIDVVRYVCYVYMIWEVFNVSSIGNSDIILYAKQYITNNTSQVNSPSRSPTCRIGNPARPLYHLVLLSLRVLPYGHHLCHLVLPCVLPCGLLFHRDHRDHLVHLGRPAAVRTVQRPASWAPWAWVRPSPVRQILRTAQSDHLWIPTPTQRQRPSYFRRRLYRQTKWI